jgi:hypothetical protein
MTMIRTIPVTCPGCGLETGTEVYDSLNVSLNPALKERLLSGSLIKWQCEVCGEQRLNGFPLLYHDMNQGVLIQWMHSNYAPTQHELAAALPPRAECDSFLAMNPEYCFRVVREFDELVEKIRIFDAGFDDRAVEWMKLHLSKQAATAAAKAPIPIAMVQPRYRRCVEMEGVSRLEIAGPLLIKMPGRPPLPLSIYPSADVYNLALENLEPHLPWPEAINGHFYCIDQDYIQRAWDRLPVIA